MKSPVYKIQKLTKIFKKSGVIANSDIDLEIPSGIVFGIFGPNGAGKTTLIKQMAGLLKPTSGTIQLKGVDVTRNPSIIPNEISYFSQTPWILWSHKVWEAVYFTGLFRGLGKKEAKIETNSLLMQLGLDSIRYHLMEKISEGQSKMVGIATALIGNRSIMILDEPTNHLDPANRALLWSTIRNLCTQRGVTVILVTHNITEAEQVVDEVAIIDKGKLISCGTPGQLKDMVSNQVRLLVTMKNRSSGKKPEFLIPEKDAEELKPGHWSLHIKKTEAAGRLGKIMSSTDFGSLEDIRVLTTTLEDVYLQLGGRSNEFTN